MNYTVRLELPQYTSSDSDVDSPYTLIDSVSGRSFLARAGEAGGKSPSASRRACGGITWRGQAESFFLASKATLLIYFNKTPPSGKDFTAADSLKVASALKNDISKTNCVRYS